MPRRSPSRRLVAPGGSRARAALAAAASFSVGFALVVAAGGALLPRPSAAQASDAAGDAASAAPRFGTVRLATGVRVHWAEQGDPAAPVVVLLHGWTDSWRSFERVFDALAATHRVVALDLRGHGESERPVDGYRVGDLAADVVAFLDAQGIERAHVVGHSLGSLVAQHVAARAPARVERLVLAGATADSRTPLVAGMRDALREMRGQVPESFAREFQRSSVARPVPPDFFERVVAASHAVPHRVWLAVADALLADDVVAPLARVTAPTLILWGERDATFDRAAQDVLLHRIAGSRLVTYPGTGHSPHWEEPERFARDVLEFLAPR